MKKYGKILFFKTHYKPVRLVTMKVITYSFGSWCREGLIRSCWNFDRKRRPHVSEIVEFLANNPRLLSPCLDVPLASVQMDDDTGQLKMALPNMTLRKCSVSMDFTSPSDTAASCGHLRQPLLPSTHVCPSTELSKYVALNSESGPDGTQAVSVLWPTECLAVTVSDADVTVTCCCQFLHFKTLIVTRWCHVGTSCVCFLHL